MLNAYLYAAILFPAKLDLSEFTFSDRVAEVVVCKFRSLLSFGMIVPASPPGVALVWEVLRGHDGRRCDIVVVLL
jgi:hypothetical protein